MASQTAPLGSVFDFFQSGPGQNPYTDLVTGDAAKQLGLDPTKQYVHSVQGGDQQQDVYTPWTPTAAQQNLIDKGIAVANPLQTTGGDQTQTTGGGWHVNDADLPKSIFGQSVGQMLSDANMGKGLAWEGDTNNGKSPLNGNFNDPNMARWDPNYGWFTPQANIKKTKDWADYVPMAMEAGMGFMAPGLGQLAMGAINGLGSMNGGSPLNFLANIGGSLAGQFIPGAGNIMKLAGPAIQAALTKNPLALLGYAPGGQYINPILQGLRGNYGGALAGILPQLMKAGS